MKRSDQATQQIVIAAIKRSTIKPIDYPLSFLPDSLKFTTIAEKILPLAPYDSEELPIVIVFLSLENWTFVTTRKVVSMVDGIIAIATVPEIKNVYHGDLKDHSNQPWRYGTITLGNDETMQIHIENHNASMMMIYGIDTLRTIS